MSAKTPPAGAVLASSSNISRRRRSSASTSGVKRRRLVFGPSWAWVPRLTWLGYASPGGFKAAATIDKAVPLFWRHRST